jgi:hypothetical protein
VKWWRRRDPGAAFDRVVRALRPLLQARGFREMAGDDTRRRTATFRLGREGVLIGWDAEYGAFTIEAREPEYGESWADIALCRIDPAVAADARIEEVIGIFREALMEYFADLGV